MRNSFELRRVIDASDHYCWAKHRHQPIEAPGEVDDF